MFTKTVLLLYFSLFISACTDRANNENNINNQLLNQQISETVIKLHIDNSSDINPVINLDTSELEKVAQQLATKRIIALGEQTHGAGSVFTLKVELIKYLHQHHGFDLIVLESGIFEVETIFNLAKQNQDIAAIAPGNIFYMYSKTEEVKPLFNYLSEQIPLNPELIFAGFDSQHTGELSNKNLLNELTTAIKNSSNDITSNELWTLTADTIQTILDASRTRLSSEDETNFLSQLDTIQTTFNADNNGYWFRISQGLEAQAKRQWGIVDNRSEEMGENVKWLAQKYPDKKMIVWAHIGHLAKKAANGVNAGQVIHNAYGDDYFVIHFTGAEGQYLDFIDLQTKNVSPVSDNSFEETLSNLDINVGYVPLSELTINNETNTMFTFNFGSPIQAPNWKTYWDGVFFINNIEPANYQD